MTSFTATRILQAAVQESVTLAELSKLAKSDPVFAMRLLSMVNSAAYAGACKVTELSQAINLLGVRGTRTVALGMVISELAPPGADGNLLVAQCIRRATAARLLGEALGDDAPDDYFTIGLLLDAGFLCGGSSDIGHALELAGTPAADRALRERALGRAPHAELGAELSKQHRLPARVTRAVALHHSREMPDEPLAAVAWTAERVAGVFEGGEIALNRERAYDAGSRLGLDDHDINQVLEALPAQVEEAASTFIRDLPVQPNIASLVNDARYQLVDMTRHYVEVVQTLERVLEEKDVMALELQEANEQLKRLASTDALTGLPNRRELRAQLAEYLLRAAARREPLSVAMVDIDHFKRVNDTMGHAAGDDVLCAVADQLRRKAREQDFVARAGGEEFALVFPGADALLARGVADRIRESIARNTVPTASGLIRVSVSVGVASLLLGEFDGDPAELFGRADAALYRAKEMGRNRVVVDPRSPLA